MALVDAGASRVLAWKTANRNLPLQFEMLGIAEELSAGGLLKEAAAFLTPARRLSGLHHIHFSDPLTARLGRKKEEQAEIEKWRMDTKEEGKKAHGCYRVLQRERGWRGWGEGAVRGLFAPLFSERRTRSEWRCEIFSGGTGKENTQWCKAAATSGR